MDALDLTIKLKFASANTFLNLYISNRHNEEYDSPLNEIDYFKRKIVLMRDPRDSIVSFFDKIFASYILPQVKGK